MPQKRCNDHFTHIKVITGESPTVNHHLFSTGKGNKCGVPFPHVQKNHFQITVEFHPVNPVGHIDDDQEYNGRKTDSCPSPVPGKKGKECESIKQAYFKKIRCKTPDGCPGKT